MPKLPGINHQRAVNAFKKTGFWIVRSQSNPVDAYTMAGIVRDAGPPLGEFEKFRATFEDKGRDRYTFPQVTAALVTAGRRCHQVSLVGIGLKGYIFIPMAAASPILVS